MGRPEGRPSFDGLSTAPTWAGWLPRDLTGERVERATARTDLDRQGENPGSKMLPLAAVYGCFASFSMPVYFLLFPFVSIYFPGFNLFNGLACPNRINSLCLPDVEIPDSSCRCPVARHAGRVSFRNMKIW